MFKEVCDGCYSCGYYITNDDTGMFECRGQKEICHEFYEMEC